MQNIKENSYKINNLSTVDKSILKSFEEDFTRVKGVLGVKFDFENSRITYAIDEWTSDYDVLCKLNEICEEKGLDLSFEDEEDIQEASSEEPVDDGESEDEKEQDDLSKIQEGDEFDEKEEKVKGKLAKSDFIEKFILFGLSLVCTIVGLLITGTIQPWILMIAFTLASYETLYDAIIKIAEKEYFIDEILTFLGALIFMYLGNTSISVLVMLSYSAMSFVKAYLTHRYVIKKEEFKVQFENSTDEQEKACIQSKVDYFENNRNVCDLTNAKTYSNKLKLSIAFFVLAFLTVFIPPFFKIQNYWDNLTSKWLYLGATILTLGSLGEYFYSCFHTAKNALLVAYENNVRINDYDKVLGFAKADKISFEIDGVLKDENENLKEDCDGAIKELKYDLGVLAEILSSKKAEEVSKVKKGLDFSGAIAGASNSYKLEHLVKTNSILVENGNNSDDLLTKVKMSIAYNFGGNATVLDSQLKRVPFIVKLAKRTDKILNFNKFFNKISKFALILLSVILTVFTSFNFALLIYGLDAISRLIIILNSQRNSTEVL